MSAFFYGDISPESEIKNSKEKKVILEVFSRQKGGGKKK
jgi:hypothetical protein